MDVVEDLCVERITKLLMQSFANVQVHSGSQANPPVFLALLKPGDTIMGMSLAAGGTSHMAHLQMNLVNGSTPYSMVLKEIQH